MVQQGYQAAEWKQTAACGSAAVDNILLLLLLLLLLPLQRPIVVLLPLSSSCIDEWCNMESRMEKIITFSPSLRTATSRAAHRAVH